MISPLPISLINNLAILPNTVAVAGLLRHAKRNPILPGEIGNDVDLTEEGITSCKLLAQKLTKQLIQIHTSPVKRCLHTARLLLQAAKVKQIQTSHLLGDPGIFVVNCRHAQRYLSQYEPLILAQQLLNQQENPSGFCRSTHEMVDQLIRYLLENATKPGLSLFITHDSILSVVLGIIFDELTLENLWPTYLEGLFLWQQQNFLHIVYRSLYKKIAWVS